MDRQSGREEHSGQAATEVHHCILCEAEIEVAEYEIYFATGYCRYCHAVVEGDEE